MIKMFVLNVPPTESLGGDASVGWRRRWLAQIEQIEEADGGRKLSGFGRDEAEQGS